MILPRLDYCDIVWNNLAFSQLETIERMQAHSAKLVLLNDSSEIALHQLGGSRYLIVANYTLLFLPLNVFTALFLHF